MGPFIARVSKTEKSGGCQSVGNYEDKGPRESSGGLDENAPYNQPHVAYGGVGNKRLQVCLTQADGACYDYTPQSEHDKGVA